MMSIETINRAESVKRGRHLEYLTIIWNSLEGIVAGLIMLPIIAGRGMEALRGEACDNCH
jgi:hypothetical protein